VQCIIIVHNTAHARNDNSNEWCIIFICKMCKIITTVQTRVWQSLSVVWLTCHQKEGNNGYITTSVVWNPAGAHNHVHHMTRKLSIASRCETPGFNVPIDTLYVILGTILQVIWSNQECHSTERQGPNWITSFSSPTGNKCNKKINIYSSMKTQDTEALRRQLNQARSKLARVSSQILSLYSVFCIRTVGL